ncbi:MAG: peptidylprolyl isomerase [Candidatus Nezhaarchaeota archaeon]|nr:peptidylprolyl isomerase [Candidatus Nezhaarchaeota archaeon]MCX8141630.1 peptidylprolyl isomerase [Candidatus Nezhaarchaeota archaeon]MDW8049897.1 FKBP-type peptidyl-prolyl cis-trans isomerase [Nitrososphaerota archaeon]
MPLQKGDFVLIDYVMRVKDTNEVVDLTIEEVAKKEKVYREDGIYEPILVILGEGWILKGVEEELYKMEVGESRVIEIPSDKAFGIRDPSKVKIVNARDLTKRGITPRVGSRVEINGSVATIRRAEGGRVILDFNHPLAGRTIVCEVKVVKKVEDINEKIRELIHRRMKRIDKEKFKISLSSDGVLTVELPPEAFTYEGLQYAKRGIAFDVARYIPGISIVKFVEAYAVGRAETKEGAEERS